MTSAPELPNTMFTDEQARAVVGKRVLVGVTHRSFQDEVVSNEQFWGVAERVNLSEGLVLRLPSSEERAIPPDLTRLQPASPGEYRLKSTGEVVIDPDFTVMWTVYPKGYKGDT